jgi:hypothetical protein
VSRLLVGALRAWWTLKVDEADGTLPASATVAARLRTVKAAWAAAAEAEGVYRDARAGWEGETGRDATTGEILPARAELEAKHAAV